jgi:hypothetical protein
LWLIARFVAIALATALTMGPMFSASERRTL